MTAPGPDGQDPEVPFDIERLVFFSDAVFAISITLLVIELAVPETVSSEADLQRALVELIPSFFSFALSFVVIALWWLSHHRLLRIVTHLRPGLVTLNFTLLMAITFLPFASGVLGHHGNLPSAVILYAATNTVAAAAIASMRWLAVRDGLLRDDVDLGAFRRRTLSTAATMLVFVASIPVALWSPDLAKYLWIGVLAVTAVRAWDERRRQRARSLGDQR